MTLICGDWSLASVFEHICVNSRFEQNVLWLQITVDQSRIFENRETIQKLLSEDAHQLQTQTLELVLLDELIEVGRQALEYKTQVALVRE